MNYLECLLRFYSYGEQGSFAKPNKILDKLCQNNFLEKNPTTPNNYPCYRITEKGIEQLKNFNSILGFNL